MEMYYLGLSSLNILGTLYPLRQIITEHDIVTKRAKFITKCIELDQEFHFASARTKLKVNFIYNSHFTGSPLWDLYGKAAISLGSSYNRTVKNIFSLPLETHRNLIEPITQIRHIAIILKTRLFGFINQVKKSPKLVPRLLLNIVENDVRSITGSNLRKMLLETSKLCVSDLQKRDILNIEYFPIRDEDKWKINIINELLEVKDGLLSIKGAQTDEIDDIISYLCIS